MENFGGFGPNQGMPPTVPSITQQRPGFSLYEQHPRAILHQQQLVAHGHHALMQQQQQQPTGWTAHLPSVPAPGQGDLHRLKICGVPAGSFTDARLRQLFELCGKVSSQPSSLTVFMAGA